MLDLGADYTRQLMLLQATADGVVLVVYCWADGVYCLCVLQVTGTPLYMAPENLRGCHGMEVDVWAAGVMVSHLCLLTRSIAG